jgi:hypothetical protein
MTTKAKFRAKSDSFLVLADILAANREFDGASALRGEYHAPGRLPFTGYLDPLHHESLKDSDYVIYSYNTPIAWRVTGGTWIVPAEKYSATTSQHQSKVRTAISVL